MWGCPLLKHAFMRFIYLRSSSRLSSTRIVFWGMYWDCRTTAQTRNKNALVMSHTTESPVFGVQTWGPWSRNQAHGSPLKLSDGSKAATFHSLCLKFCTGRWGTSLFSSENPGKPHLIKSLSVFVLNVATWHGYATESGFSIMEYTYNSINTYVYT